MTDHKTLEQVIKKWYYAKREPKIGVLTQAIHAQIIEPKDEDLKGWYKATKQVHLKAIAKKDAEIARLRTALEKIVIEINKPEQGKEYRHSRNVKAEIYAVAKQALKEQRHE